MFAKKHNASLFFFWIGWWSISLKWQFSFWIISACNLDLNSFSLIFEIQSPDRVHYYVCYKFILTLSNLIFHCKHVYLHTTISFYWYNLLCSSFIFTMILIDFLVCITIVLFECLYIIFMSTIWLSYLNGLFEYCTVIRYHKWYFK